MPSDQESDRVAAAAGPLAGSSTEPPPPAPGERSGPPEAEQLRVVITRRRVIASVIFVVGIVVFLYFGLPKLVGFGASIKRLQQGNVWWLAVAALLEVCSFGGYVALFRAVFLNPTSRIGWNASYQITMAGLAATRLFAAAGAGGIALTAWALRRSGLDRRFVASHMVAFMALLYAVYMGAFVVDGVGLYVGVWPGGTGSFALTIIPAIFGAIVIALVASMTLLPGDMERLAHSRSRGQGIVGRLARRLSTVPVSAANGVRIAIGLIRGRDPGLLGAVVWWGFDIATLWACFHAFGYSPHAGVIVMAYFIGWIANTLPLPGGIGGVEGGMIGSFTAFGVGVQGAVVSVLAYRAFSFWLPTLPGAVAYFQLRRTVHHWEQADAAAEPPSGSSSATPSYT
jgi:uncharacterized protein (TIRG00374 family)